MFGLYQETMFVKKKFIEILKKEVGSNVIGSIYGIRVIELKEKHDLHRWAMQGQRPDYHLHEIMGYMMNNGKMIILLGSKLKQLPLK